MVTFESDGECQLRKTRHKKHIGWKLELERAESLPLFRFGLPLFHSHHHPRGWVLLIQLHRLRNQFLHSWLLHVGNSPQLHVAHTLSCPLQQFLRVRQHRPAKKCKRHMIFTGDEAAQRPVRVERRDFPGTHVLLPSLDGPFQQSPYRLRYALQLPRLLHISINPDLRWFPLNRRHGFLPPAPFYSSCPPKSEIREPVRE